MNPFDLFFDPVFRAPMWGTLLMCIASSLVGTILFLQKKTLLSESLSHATYPGVVLGVALLGCFFPSQERWAFVAVLLGALFSSYIALKAIHFLQEKQKISPDASLCFVLSFFFGIGVLGVSAMQSILPSWNKQIQMLLFGQAATMTDIHIILYAVLACCVICFVWLMFHPLKAVVFDRDFSRSIRLPVRALEKILFWSLLISLVLGMRSVGVVLMSGMVVAPAVAARQYTNCFSKMLALSAFFGACSGILGNILSITGTLYLSRNGEILTIPTGPMIILVGGFFAFYALAFAPERGLVFRKLRIRAFHLRCLEENGLKGFWKKGPQSREGVHIMLGISFLRSFLLIRRLLRKGWIVGEKGIYHLTVDGTHKAASIVRLHRLWELYLASMLKLETDKVHKNAEEMEHILTPEIESKLTLLLANPTKDPHEQPIPHRIGQNSGGQKMWDMDAAKTRIFKHERDDL